MKITKSQLKRLIKEELTQKAVRTLHKAFGLN